MREPSSRPPSLARRGRTFAVIGILLATAMAAQEPTPAGPTASGARTAAPSTAPGESAGAPARGAGLRLYLDPETGEITTRPTPEQELRLSEALQRALSREFEDLTPFSLRGGGTGVHLDGRFQSATVLRVRPDGTYSITCVEDPEQAVRLLGSHHPQAAPSAGETAAPVR